MTARQQELLAAYDRNSALLVSAGFERICGWMAGIHSGSSWMHADGRKAEILVINDNEITYTEAPVVCSVCGSTEEVEADEEHGNLLCRGCADAVMPPKAEVEDLCYEQGHEWQGDDDYLICARCGTEVDCS